VRASSISFDVNAATLRLLPEFYSTKLVKKRVLGKYAFLQLKRHDFEPLLNCQKSKLQNSSWEYLAENFLSSRFIIMQ